MDRDHDLLEGRPRHLVLEVRVVEAGHAGYVEDHDASALHIALDVTEGEIVRGDRKAALHGLVDVLCGGCYDTTDLEELRTAAQNPVSELVHHGILVVPNGLLGSDFREGRVHELPRDAGLLGRLAHMGQSVARRVRFRNLCFRLPQGRRFDAPCSIRLQLGRSLPETSRHLFAQSLLVVVAHCRPRMVEGTRSRRFFLQARYEQDPTQHQTRS